MLSIRQTLTLFEDIGLFEAFDPDNFLQKLRGVMELVRRGATEGERAAARTAFDRLAARAKEEVARMRQPSSGTTHTQVDHFLRVMAQISADKDPPKASTQSRRPAEPPPRQAAVPRFKIGQFVVATDPELDIKPEVGKIVDIIRRGITDIIHYNVAMLYGTGFRFNERDLRGATQEDVDAAQVRYRAKYRDGDYVIVRQIQGQSDVSRRVGRIIAGGVNWDREEQVRSYTVEFAGGGWDLLDESDLQPPSPALVRVAEKQFAEAKAKAEAEKAKAEKAKAERPRYNYGGDEYVIMNMARYTDPSKNSDKVYGVVLYKKKTYTFWGGVNKSLSTHWLHPNDANEQFQSKIHKGYREMDRSEISRMENWVIAALKIRFGKLDESRQHRD